MHIWFQLTNHLPSGDRPAALLPVAGAPTLAHLLAELRDLWAQASGLTFSVAAHAEQVEAWLAENVPDIATAVQVTSAFTLPAIPAQEPLLIVAGESIVLADYAEALAEAEASDTAVLLFTSRRYPPNVWGSFMAEDGETAHTGLVWLREARLWQAGDWLTAVSPVRNVEAAHWLPITNKAERLEANVRLLGIGYGSDNAAIERSYIDGFTVVPPVFIHDEADIDAAVVGPYASIGAGTVVRNSIVRRSIIEEDCTIEDMVLTDSLISPQNDLRGDAATREL